MRAPGNAFSNNSLSFCFLSSSCSSNQPISSLLYSVVISCVYRPPFFINSSWVPLLHHFAIVHNHDFITVTDRRKPVRHNNAGNTPVFMASITLYSVPGIQSAGCFIQYNNTWVLGKYQAISSLCRCPPEKFLPPSESLQSYPSWSMISSMHAGILCGHNHFKITQWIGPTF